MLKLTQSLLDFMIDEGLTHAVLNPNKETVEIWRKAAARALMDEQIDADTYNELTEGEGDLADECDVTVDSTVKRLNHLIDKFEIDLEQEEDMSRTKSSDVFNKGGDATVKKASERYSDKSYSARHAKSGETMFDEMGREVREPSERNYALTGALYKHLAYKSGLASAKPNEHEEELLTELAMDKEWAGDLEGEYCKSIAPHGHTYIKALLDDNTSGGLEIAPIHFDDDIVSFPQLHGELWPFVGKKDVARGRRVEGGSIQNITVTSGEGADNSEMALFNTASLVAAINTTIFPVGTAVEIGRDFLSDAAVDVGRLVTKEIGQSMLAWLDEQVAIGNGTTEPEGIMAASGTTAVSFGSAAATVGGYESLLFSVPKAQRPKSPAVRFCGTETSYQRMKAIAVGTADARRVFGGGFMGTESHEDWMCLGRPYAISTAMTNAQLFFGDLARGYRAYRRVGGAPEVHTQGSYLARRNLALIVYRARFGGKVVLPSSFGVVNDAQA